MKSLPVRRFAEVRALLLLVILLLVLGCLLPLVGLYVMAYAPREDPDPLMTTAAAVAAAIQEGQLPVVPGTKVGMALYRGEKGLWKVGAVPPTPYWPFPSRAGWEQAGRPTVAQGEWQGQRLRVVLWPVGEDRLLQVVAPVEENRHQRWLAATVLLSLVLALAGGGLAWFLVGRVLSPYGELLEEAKRFSGRMGGGPEDVFLVSTFRQAVQRVEEQERELAARAQELSELSAGLAHELRNNLSVMEGYLRLARENPQELARYLQVLAAEVQAQREFLERFMTFVRPVAAQKTTFRLGPLVTQVASRLASAFPQVKLECVGDAELVADPTAVRVVLENLLRNACEAASRRADGRVKATVQLEARKVQVVVEDNGPGIPEDQRGTLFEPFVSQKPAGGIGLALARRLARAMGGEVELVSAREPTAFVARFPQEASS